MECKVPFLLASSSPRRRHLLSILGIDFDVSPPDVGEDYDGDPDPEMIVEELAERKAAAVAAARPDALVLGADTLVVLDGDILGKPDGPEDAAGMLRRLSGRTHTVFTGLALVHGQSGRTARTHVRTDVTFDELSDQEITSYVATGSPLDKAGAYGIQEDLGAAFVAGVSGDYYNVVGLPINCLYRMLRTSFNDLVTLSRPRAATPSESASNTNRRVEYEPTDRPR